MKLTTSAPTSALTTVFAIGLKIRPSTRCKEKIGRYAAMMIRSENSVGFATSRAASRIHSSSGRSGPPPPTAAPLPSGTRWNRCSTRITAPSTMIPKSTAPIDSRFADIPRQYR